MATSGFSPNPGIPALLSGVCASVLTPVVCLYGMLANKYGGIRLVGLVGGNYHEVLRYHIR